MKDEKVARHGGQGCQQYGLGANHSRFESHTLVLLLVDEIHQQIEFSIRPIDQAMPMSRNISQVTCHSPSHLI
jgi:hypothetical protein